MRKRLDGFTITELITIIVILGIVAAIAAPRFFDRNTFDERSFYDQTLATLRFAQKLAIAQRRTVCVSFPTTSSIQLTIASAFGMAACDTNVMNSNGTATYTVTSKSGVTLSGIAPFTFDPLGVPSAPQNITVGGYAVPVVVSAGTGYVK